MQWRLSPLRPLALVTGVCHSSILRFSLAVAALLLASGDVFDGNFQPTHSRYFKPESSASFKLVSRNVFDLEYADSTVLKGYQASDVVRLGDLSSMCSYQAFSTFGAISYCNSPDFNGVDGILGFGLPVPALTRAPIDPSDPFGGQRSNHPFEKFLPTPLLFSLTDLNSRDDSVHGGARLIPRRAFSFLGGYDPLSVEGEMHMTANIAREGNFAVKVFSIKYAGKELLHFWAPPADAHNRTKTPYAKAIIDSGTSCLVLPSAWSPILKNSPWSEWTNIVGPVTDRPLVHSDFELNLGGFVLRIPFDVWYFSHLNSSCVQNNGDMGEVLVGDVLFRRYVVLFDLTMPHQVALGFGLRNRSYTLGTSHAVVTKHAVAKVSTDSQGFPSNYPGPPLATDIVSIQNKHNTQYFINVSIGSPPQPFRVIFDTGSSVFGVFSQCDPDAAGSSFASECTFGVKSQAALPMPSSAWVLFWATLCISIVASIVGIAGPTATARLKLHEGCEQQLT